VELRTVRYFVAVADAGSVNAAAQALHLTQPSLARQLHRLERRLGLTLLEPRGGRLVVTPAGRSFLPHARELLARADAATAAVAELAAGRLPSVRVAASSIVVTSIVAPYIAELGDSELCPTVITTDGGAVYDRLESDVDLVLAASPPTAGVDRLRLARLPIMAHARADHRLAARSVIELADLVSDPLVVAGMSSVIRRRLDAVLALEGLAPPVITEVDSTPVAQALAAAGHGIALLTDEPRFDLDPIPIMTADGTTLSIEVHAAWKPQHHAAPSIAALARRLHRATTARLDRTRHAATRRAESAA
jgi:LysR family transcriptional regulator, benzoate and cis,cis-muconate-responsive activator of ben and cat genes